METWVKRSAAFTVIRDLVLLGVGSFILLYQTVGPPERVNFILVGAGLAILGIPGSIGLLNLGRGRQTQDDTPPPSPPSRQRSSSRR
jgi:hypothetical protein